MMAPPVGATLVQAQDGEVSDLEVEDAFLAPGENGTLDVTVTGADGTELDVGSYDDVAVGDDGVLNASDNGAVDALDTGQTTVEITHGGESDTATVTVVPFVQQIALEDGDTGQLQVTGFDADGNVTDVADEVNVTVENESVATVADDGTVTAEGVGETTVQIEYDGETDTAPVTVIPPAPSGKDPATYQGTITVDGELADEGAQLMARIDGETEDTTTVGEAGQFGDEQAGALEVHGSVGDEVDFFVAVDGEWHQADQSAAWEPEAEVEIDLTAATDVTELALQLDDELTVGETATATVTAHTDDASWEVTGQATVESDDEDVLNVSDDGTVEAVGAGEATVSASYGGVSDDVTVTVIEEPPSQPPAVYHGTLTIDGADEENTTVEARIDGEARGEITVDDDGVYSPDDERAESLEVEGYEGEEGANVSFYVYGNGLHGVQATPSEPVDWQPDDYRNVDLTVDLEVTGVELDVADEELVAVGDTTKATVNATVEDADDRVVTDEADYEVTEGDAVSVDENGTVAAVGTGEATIRATYEDDGDTFTDTANVTVEADPVERIELDVDDGDLVRVGDRTDATVTAEYASGALTDVTGGADLDVVEGDAVSVHENGTVTAENVGEATIEATFEDEDTGKIHTDEATVEVQVDDEKVSDVQLELGEDLLEVDGSSETNVTATYEGGETATVTADEYESADGSVATVDDDGVVTAVGEGVTDLTATVEGVESDPVTVTVVQSGPDPFPAAYHGEVTIGDRPAPTGLAVEAEIGGVVRGSVTVDEAGVYADGSANSTRLIVDGSEALEGEPVEFYVTGDEIDERVPATPDETVTWTSGDVRAVNLSADDRVTGIGLDVDDDALTRVGDETNVTVAATLDVLDEVDVTDQADYEVIEGDAVSVDENGTVTAENVGEATIEATYEDEDGVYTDTAEVTVDDGLVTGIDLEIADDELVTVGDETPATVTAIVDGHDDRDVTDQADIEVTEGAENVSVDDDGTITAEAVGEATIRATYEDDSGTLHDSIVDVEVEEGLVTAIDLDIDDDALVEPGDSTAATVEATVEGDDDRIVTADAEFAVIEGDAVSVAADGTVTAVGPGEATVQASYEGQTDTASVTVEDGALESIDLVLEETLLTEGTTTNATVAASYEGGDGTVDVTDAAEFAVIEGDAVSVAADGTVTAEVEGVATLEATFEGERANASVSVVESGPMPFPAAYFGTLEIDGEPAPENTTVEAEIDGAVRGSATVTEEGVYAVDDPDGEALLVKGTEADAGANVTFYVEGDGLDRTEATADENVTWESGDIQQVNLAAEDDDGTDGGGGGGGAPGPVPTPSFTVSDTSISTEKVAVGEAFDVEATIENVGTGTGAHDVQLTRDGEVVAERSIVLRGGESETVTFTESIKEPGEYEYAVDGVHVATVTVGAGSGFQTTDASLSATEVEVGEEVEVTATVENVGDKDGTHTVQLLVDGEVVNEQDVSLDAGDSETVTFSHAFDDAGEYEIAVDDADAGTLIVSDTGIGLLGIVLLLGGITALAGLIAVYVYRTQYM